MFVVLETRAGRSAADDLASLGHQPRGVAVDALADLGGDLAGLRGRVGPLQQAGELVAGEREEPWQVVHLAAGDVRVEPRQLGPRAEVPPGTHQRLLAV